MLSVAIWTAVSTLAAAPPGQTGAPASAPPTTIAVPAAPAPAEPQTLPPAPPPSDHTDIVVTGRGDGGIDPLRAVNEQSFQATQTVDRALVAPLARAYTKAAPKPFRKGVHNILYNLREPVVFVNFLLQHKIGKAVETVGRFGINSTIGLLGAFDIAKRKPFKLPRRGNGFADTLGFYGVPPGPFMFLPLVGPTTVRDLIGGSVDRLVLPVAFGGRATKPEFAVPAAVLGALDHRAEFDTALHALHDNAADPYANTRTFYLQRRQAEIDHLRGRDKGSSSPMSEAPTVPIDARGREVKVAPAAQPVDPAAQVRP
jgi:phospholipid-binding lipoprotein MlaA